MELAAAAMFPLLFRFRWFSFFVVVSCALLRFPDRAACVVSIVDSCKPIDHLLRGRASFCSKSPKFVLF
jgi:hypothetical protein